MPLPMLKPVSDRHKAKDNRFFGDVVQSVRTPACHAGGREFEPRRPRQISKRVASFAALF